MNKYVKLETDLFSIFGSTAWKANNIPSYPSDYTTEENNTEFIRISMIPSNTGINSNSIEGIIMIDIFIPANMGLRRAWTIADLLDTFLQENTIRVGTSTTQFFKSTAKPAKAADDNNSKTLTRVIYTIPFKHFGVK